MTALRPGPPRRLEQRERRSSGRGRARVQDHFNPTVVPCGCSRRPPWSFEQRGRNESETSHTHRSCPLGGGRRHLPGVRAHRRGVRGAAGEEVSGHGGASGAAAHECQPTGTGRRCHSDRDPPDRGGSTERDDRRRGACAGPRTVPVGAGDHQGGRGSLVEHGLDQCLEHRSRRRTGLCQRHRGARPQGGQPRWGVPSDPLRARRGRAPDHSDESARPRWPWRLSCSA